MKSTRMRMVSYTLRKCLPGKDIVSAGLMVNTIDIRARTHLVALKSPRSKTVPAVLALTRPTIKGLG